jgi:hypothetical protein
MATGRIGTNTVLTTRWSKAPAGGTTSLSGLDDNSVSLVYSVGYEQVYRNGVLLSRGNDYTATNGTTITLIDATITGDIIEVFANELIPLTDAISKGQFTAKGALLSASAAATPAVLAVGTNGQVLKADSSTTTGLAWGSDASGKVLQVVSAVYSTSTGITTTSYADTGLTATITPTLSTSKILVLISQHITLSGGTVSGGAVKVLRGATDIYTVAGTNNQAFLAGETAANSYLGGSFAFNYLDSPATTSATTYKTQGRRNSNASSVMTFNGDGASSSITLLEIGA